MPRGTTAARRFIREAFVSAEWVMSSVLQVCGSGATVRGVLQYSQTQTPQISAYLYGHTYQYSFNTAAFDARLENRVTQRKMPSTIP
ncbi:hypothetical protein AZKH_p0634 (plasmid) [Azoarcus sp. KH32C]|nr:hypothetical protein AZKH_p0634 [Azoarcus sp. KH32C]